MAPNDADSLDYRSKLNNTKKWWFADPCLRVNIFHCLGLCFAMFFNGYDGSLFNGLQSMSTWQEYFAHPDPKTLGLMNSDGFLPGIVSGFFGDWMQHYVGKRWTIWINTLVTVVGIIVITISTDVGMFCAGRVIQGFGTSATLAVAPAQLQEISHPRYRASVGALFSCTYYIAAILSAAVCLGALPLVDPESWRIPCWVQLFGPAMVFLMTFSMPESPRWLVRGGKHEEARQILIKHHANGQQDDELANYEYREICSFIEEENNLPQTTYSDFLKTPGNRHRLMIIIVAGIAMNWVGNGIISYYLSPILGSLGIKNTTTQLKILIGMHCWNLVVSSCVSVFIDTIGRRPMWLTATGGQMTTMAVVMGLSGGYANTGTRSLGVAVIPFFFLFYGFYNVAYTPMSYSYPIENLTFSMRTKGSAIYVAIGTCAVALNVWVNPIALDALDWKYYGVYIGINLVLLIVQYFGYPETKNLTIEQIATVFDGKAAVIRAHAGQGEEGQSTEVRSIREEPEIKE